MSYKRVIRIDGRNYSHLVNSCTFSWTRDGGPSSASLYIEQAPFDDFENIEMGDIVEIRYSYSASSNWWKGVVDELETEMPNGLRVTCSGLHTLLKNSFPEGKYGEDQYLGVKDFVNTDITYLTYTSDGNLDEGTYYYRVSAVDTKGNETQAVLASGLPHTFSGGTNENRIVLSWDSPTYSQENVAKYRIYKGNSNPYELFETKETTWTDEGRYLGEDVATLPASNNTDTADIVALDVESVLEDILGTYMPSELNSSLSEIDAGSGKDLDDYVLDGTSDLRSVISALADIVGSVVWGVDEEGKVYFKERDTTSVEETYKVGKDSQTVNVVSGLSRYRSRDVVDAVRVEGEDKLNSATQKENLVTSITTKGRNTKARFLPGVRRSELANSTAENIKTKYVDNPDRWRIEIENIDKLIKPGLHNIKIVTPNSQSYILEVQSVNYDFGDFPKASISAGDPILEPEEEEQETRRVQNKSALRKEPEETVLKQPQPAATGSGDSNWVAYTGP